MFRVAPNHGRFVAGLLAGLACIAATTGIVGRTGLAHAQPFTDLGPALGLPSQLSGPAGQSLSAGLTVADLDGDGDLDVLANTPTLGLVAYLRGPTTFTAATDLLPQVASSGAVFGHTLFDADSDGDLDLHVSRDDGDRLYFATAAGFIDVTATHFAYARGWTTSSTAVDFDGDGDLDLLVARYIDRIDFPSHRCHTNRVLENDGRGVFTDITDTAGLSTTRGCSFSNLVFDADDDGDLDFLTVNDFTQFTGITELWRNDGPDTAGLWRFTEVAAEHDLKAPIYGMGAAFGDLDQNGHPDLFITSIGEPLLFERRPDLGFAPTNESRNVFARFAFDRHQATWTARFEDLDGDGHLDIIAAGGNLPAAPFIGNPPNIGSLILMGQPDGTLAPLPLALDLPREGHSARDFELADLDGDSRPELVTLHVHGRISVFENLGLQTNPTQLRLVPSTTGDNAAGATVALTCGGITRTRHVTVGGDYGNADAGIVRLHFPAPCNTAGLTATGTLRWPSGFVQAISVTTGASHTIAEPSWLTITDTHIEVDLSEHLGPATPAAFVVSGHNLALGPTAATDRVFTTAYTLVDPTSEARLDLTIDGVLWGVHPRFAGTTPTLSLGVVPIAGRRIIVRASFPWPSAATNLSARLGTTLTPFTAFDDHTFIAEVVLPQSPGPATLDLMDLSDDDVLATLPLQVEGTISATNSEVVVRELHILAAERDTRRVRFRSRLIDANGDPAGLPLESLAVLVDGVPMEPDSRTTENGYSTLGIEHNRLTHGTLVQLTVDGVPTLAPHRVIQLADAADLGLNVSPTRSLCGFSESQARADGEDRMTAIIHFNDENGAHLTDFGLRPTLETVGIDLVPGTLELGYNGWSVQFRASETPGLATLSASLPGMVSPVTCQIRLTVPPALPDPIVGSPIVALTAVPRIGEVIIFRFWPFGVDHRSLGSGVPLTTRFSDNVTSTSPTYVGQGRYEATAIPQSAGPVTVELVADDGVTLSTITLDDPTVPADPGPEPSPEESPELAESVEDAPDTIGGDTEDTTDNDSGDLADEPDDDTVEDSATAEDTPGHDDTTVSDASDIDALSDAVDATTPDPDAVSDDVDATTPDPDPTDPSPEARTKDDGCGSGTQGGWPITLALLVLYALSRFWSAQAGPKGR